MLCQIEKRRAPDSRQQEVLMHLLHKQARISITHTYKPRHAPSSFTMTAAQKNQRRWRLHAHSSDAFNRSRRRVQLRRWSNSNNAAPPPTTAAAEGGPPESAIGLQQQPAECTSSPYMQQVMPGWRPSFSCPQLASTLAIIALILSALAGFCFNCWTETAEVELNYTECARVNTTAASPSNCKLPLVIKSHMRKPVYIYYALSNAYFTHRRIHVAWSMPQLMGRPAPNLSKPCRDHLRRNGSIVLPCGALPNAIFNDTVEISVENSSATSVWLKLKTKGIIWPSLIKGLYRPLSANQLARTVPPDSWPESAAQRYSQPFSDAEDLHEWLRAPAFSNFRKMSHILDESDGLCAGRYTVHIVYKYPVNEFGGAKRVIIAGKSQMGGRNAALLVVLILSSVCYVFLCISTLFKYC